LRLCFSWEVLLLWEPFLLWELEEPTEKLVEEPEEEGSLLWRTKL
jgi:hypothetical protein